MYLCLYSNLSLQQHTNKFYLFIVINLQQDQNITEEDLLSKLQHLNHKDFELIYDKYADRLFYYILSKTGDQKQSEDILQDVFIEFWNKKNKVEQSVYGFLFHITKCMILNHYRSKRVREEYIMHLSTYLQDINSVTPQKYVEAKEIMAQIEKLVSQFPLQCRKVFVMSRFKHMSNAEIAEELQISKRTVENYITKSLSFLRKNNISIYILFSIFLENGE